MKSNGWGTGPKGKATRLHSLVVRARGRCERCGRSGDLVDVKFPGLPVLSLPVGGLQAAHIVGRRYAATRTDETNAWALDASCHMRLTEHPDEHMAFVDQTIGRAAFDEMKRRAVAGVKTSDAFWLAEVDRLTQLLKDAA